MVLAQSTEISIEFFDTLFVGLDALPLQTLF
jgi:hypothetical protein